MHPYQGLDEKFFWATAVAGKHMYDIADLWSPKFPISMQDKVVTFGSCFAQHFSQALVARGFNWLNTEQAPTGLNANHAKKYNYGIFSSRTGNIYTTSLLKQWVDWASGKTNPPEECWEKEGRFFDPFRPKIEPSGFGSRKEVLLSREMAIESFKTAIFESNVFVYTLGLTESWINKEHGYEYPMCPGTAAGEFKESQHAFVNQRYQQILHNLHDAIENISQINPNIKFLLTVSPVPLTATMSEKHVLVATMESKSILRAVAGFVSEELDCVDYFPSYEIINATPYRGSFFEPNLRSVNHTGVEHVMSQFFNCLNTKFPFSTANSTNTQNRKLARTNKPNPNRHVKSEDVVCEEEILAAFGK